MVKKTLLFILFFISINAQYSEEVCQKIECSNDLDTGSCIRVESTTSFFKECPKGEICDIEFDDPVQNSNCKTKESFKRLPTLSCDKNEDCLRGECVGNKCLGKYEGEKCSSVTDCVYGYTCRKDSENNFRCLKPITTGNKCELDTDCVGDSGCLNNICTKYFSIDNNQQSRDMLNGELSFCKSGYSDELGICKNLTLINENSECSQNNKCQYNDMDNEETISIDRNCLCGYNKEGKKYCLLGSGNKNFTKYINLLKEYYLSNQNCHLSERNAEPCQKDLLSNDSFILKRAHELINAKYWAKSNNKLIGAQECVYKVELPDYDRDLDRDNPDPEPEPIPGEGSCAKYKCEEKNPLQEFCAMSNYKNNFNINISLYDICSSGVECKIGGDPNDIFYNRTNINSKCYEKVENKRYPGEKCSIDSECVYPLNNPSTQFHKCEDGRCNGMEEDGICEDNSWCISGYYCDQFSGKCKEQKGSGKECLNSKECQNDFICLNNKCSDDLYSLKDGEKVPSYEEKEYQKLFCKSGEVIDSICVSYNDKEKKLDDSEYRKCNFGGKCVYKINGLKYEKDLEISCPCGYNADGQGYCPHFHDYSTKDWNNYRKTLKKNYNNECHTENRLDCYRKEDKDKEKKYKNDLEKGHLFYKSAPCAKKVLNGKYLFIKKLYMILGILLILL